jgi:N-methylhydantoinase A
VNKAGVVFGVDTGGTFTDIVGLDGSGRIIVRKVDNRAVNATESIAEGVASLVNDASIPPGSVSKVVHCTTILGNSVIERKGPICGLITTEGFRDVLELGRQHNPVLYDIFWKKTRPLVPRRRVVEVKERIAADGSTVLPIDPDSLEAALSKLEEHGVQSVAICLINACTNAAHEEAIAERVRERLPTVTISLSSQISPEWGEYERTSTTVTDAFLKPTFAAYLTSLRERLDEHDLRPELFVMQSSGSIAPVDAAMAMPVHSLDSGPAAAVVAAANIGAALGLRDILTLEIGGTTAKSTLIENGEPRRTTESEIGTPIGSDGRALRGGGYALRMPVIDAAEVGAGGGSIARVDAGGSLSVGPEGAGAFPGPASYGRGGAMPTVTDANLVLGYLSETQPLGGTISLKRMLAEEAINKHVAGPLGLSTLEAAFAIRSLANAIIGRAVRTVSTERGRDVRRFTLLAAGGGGPGHAAEIARVLGISTVVIPPYAGLFASLGMLWSPPERRVSHAVKLRLERTAAAAELDEALRALFAATGDNSFGEEPAIYEEVDVHYVGQFHELTVPAVRQSGVIDTAGIRRAFEAEHERSYGYNSPHENCEVGSVRLVVRYKGPVIQPNFAEDHASQITQDVGELRQIYFGSRLGMQTARLFSRKDLPEKPIQGPVVIPEYDTTIIVPPDFTVRREKTGALILERVKARD